MAKVVRLERARPQARGVATRRRVLAAAEALFTRRGYEATGMADVAERAGIGGGTLYHHFPDKRALLLALIDDWADREMTRNRTELDIERWLGDDPRKAIASHLETGYRELRRDGGFFLVILELAERDSDVRTRFAMIDRVATERFAGQIAFGQSRGQMRKELDPLAAAFLVRHSIRLAATEVLVHRVSEPAPERVLEGLIDMICRYLLEEHP